jgi:ribosomal protein S14
LRKLNVRKSQKKNGSANRKSAKCLICGRSANITNYWSPEICRFAICETYLRATHLC